MNQLQSFFWRTLFITVLIISFCSAPLAVAQPKVQKKPTKAVLKLREDITKILSDTLFIPARCGIKIASLETGEVLFERDSKMLLHPASNMKLLTSATALVELGTTYKFKTIMSADAKIVDDTLEGNLYLKGFGNPDFQSSDLATMIAQLKQRGITTIKGDIVADKTYFDDWYWGSGWMWDDEPEQFEAYISPLTINDNCVAVYVTPGKNVGDTVEVRIEPQTAYVNFINEGKTIASGEKSKLKVTRKWRERENTILITGGMPLGRETDETVLSVWNVEQY
jgi:PBP4 family serine-type D-alanyl-D-alanine carboxypeptidase